MAEETRVGSYLVIDVLGQGGMGVVYRARHIETEQIVALKTVRVLSPSWMSSIRREIHALTRVRHPGLVRILDQGLHHGVPWYAMDLLEGETLRLYGERLWRARREDRISPQRTEDAGLTALATEQARFERAAVPAPLLGHASKPRQPAGAGALTHIVQIFAELCSTLAYLHGEGFLNCDLKPENILLVDGHPVIIDFGLTARIPRASREPLDALGIFAGTLPYMSPEQIRGELLDARSDLYSLGCMLYEFVTGQPPFLGPGLLEKHLSESPVPPSQRVSDIPPELDRIILRLLDKELNARFGFGDEVARELLLLIGQNHAGASSGSVAPYLYRPRFVGRGSLVERICERHDAAIGGAGCLALVGGESGSGKTRVLIEITRLVQTAHMSVVTSEVLNLSARGADAVAAGPLHAVRPLLQAIADCCHEGGPELTELLLGPERAVLEAYDPSIAHVPASGAVEPALPLSAEASRRRLFRVLANALQAFANQQQPLLWVIDDLGWADELSLAFLSSLDASFFAQTPVLILCTFRSEERNAEIQRLCELSHVHNYRLSGLEQADIATMVSDMLALPEPPKRLVRFVTAEAGGNPFFVSEYLQAAVASRILHRDPTRSWRFTADLPGTDGALELMRLPSSLRELIEQRYMRLEPAAQRLALAASVLGREVDTNVLLAVAALSDEAALEALDELLRTDVLTQPEPERVRFVHDKLREFAYTSIGESERIALHSTAANVLQQRLAATPEDAAHVAWAALGHHFAAALQHDAGARYYKLAADHARGTHANQDAIRLYRDALRQLELAWPQATFEPAAELAWSELQESLGDMLTLTGLRQEARAAYEQARGRSPVGSSAAARLLRKLGKTHEIEHAHDHALDFYAQAQASLGVVTSPDRGLMDEWIQCHVEQLWVFYWQARVADMDALIARIQPHVLAHGSSLQHARYFQARVLANCRRDRFSLDEETVSYAGSALHASRALDAQSELPMAQFLYGFALLLARQPYDAHEELRHAERLARRAGDNSLLARCLTYLAVDARMRASLSETAQYTSEALYVSKANGFREYVAAALANQAWVQLRRGEREQAVSLARSALETWASLTLVFPFQWLALLPLLEIAVLERDVSKAMQVANSLLLPTQQRVPEHAMEALLAAMQPADVEKPELHRLLTLSRALRHMDSTTNATG